MKFFQSLKVKLRERETVRHMLVGMTLFVISVVSRIPFQSKWLYTWDSANFALGILRFSPRAHQPHPPGYPLYIALARVVNFFISDPNGSLVVLSILAFAISVVAIYLVGTKIFNEKTGLLSAFLLLFSPLIWFQSEVALSHIIELPFVIIAAWLMIEVFWRRRVAFALACALVIGVGAGFRQDVLFLIPMFAVCTFRLKNYRYILGAWLALLFSILLWYVPLLYFVDDISAYRQASSLHFETAVAGTAFWNVGWSGVADSLDAIWRSIIWLCGFFSLGVIFCSIVLFSKKVTRTKLLLFLVAMPLPALLFFAATGFTHPGYILICAGPWVLVFAHLLMKFLDMEIADPGFNRIFLYGMLSAFLIFSAFLNSMMFLNIEKFGWNIPSVGQINKEFGDLTLSGIRQVDEQLGTVVHAIEATDADSTLAISIIPSDHDTFPDFSRQLIFYLPAYRTVWLRLDSSEPLHQFQNHLETFSGTDNEITIPGNYEKVIIVGMFPNQISNPSLHAVLISNDSVPITGADFPAGGSLKFGKYSLRH